MRRLDPPGEGSPPSAADGFITDPLVRSLVEGITDQLIVLRAVRNPAGEIVDWRYVDANSGAVTLVGIPRERLLRLTIRERLPPDRLAFLHPLLVRALLDGGRHQYETTIGGHDLLVTLFRLDAVKDTVVSASMEITRQKVAEQRAERIARFPEQNPDPVLRVAHGRVEYANRAALEVLRPIGLALDGAPPAALARLAEQATQGGGPVAAALVAGARVFSVRAVPAADGVNVYGQDATERVRAEENQALLGAMADDFARLSGEEEILKAIGARLAAHLDITTCTVADFADGVATIRYAFTRPGAVEVATTLRVSDYLNDELQAAARAGQTVVIRDMRADPRVDGGRSEALGVRAGVIVPFLEGGEWRHSFSVGTPEARDWREDQIRLLQEAAIRFFPRMARARAEEALRASDRRKSEFIGILSHEIRNTLAPLRTSVAVLERVGSTVPAAVRARDVLTRQLEHLGRLVDDLLDIRRLERGGIQLRKRVVDAAEVVSRVCEALAPTLHGAGIELVFHGAGPVPVLADETRLHQMVANLLDNAGKFTDRGGRVAVDVRATPQVCQVEVTDSGAGLEPSEVATLFDPFVQAEHAMRRGRGGLGLGLALVRQLAEAHGGRVWAASPGPRRGSTFTVELPLHRDRPTAGPTPASAGDTPRRLSVVLVEDGADAGATLRDLLELEGHEVRLFPTGGQALRSLDERPADVLLCDIGLADMTGYDVMRTIRRSERPGRRLFAVALTGMARPEDVRRAEAAGFDAHLPKPAPWTALVELLSRS